MNQVTTAQPKQPATIKQHLEGEQFRATIAKVLPKHLSPDRMARVAITALTRTPMLAECDQASFFRCLMDLSQWGLEPDGRRAHLIPFRNNQKGIVECQLIIDYKGLVELCYRSGVVSNIHADVVCENDVFDFDLGEITRHKIDFKAERGKVYAAYAIVTMKDGTKKCEVLSKQELDGIRARSKAGKSGPWVSDYNEMAKKTAFRRVSKWIPLSAEIRDAIHADDDVIEGEIVQSRTTRPGLNDLTDMLIASDDRNTEPTTASHPEVSSGEIPPQEHNSKVLADFKALLPTLTTKAAVKAAAVEACKSCVGPQEQMFHTNDLIIQFGDARCAELEA
jgi:recombination protein RecT